MNYLSIDLGDKRCGIAYSNMGIIFTLPFVERFKLVGELKKIIIEKNISEIVIGMPFDLYGKDLRQLDKTKKFVLKLKQIFKNIEIIEVDERFTTFESINILTELGGNKKDILEKKDSISAYLILERFLSQVNT
ncbi:MAG: Holliday junction resolvase RuvX [Candidatus Gracilibacteria bacterium]|nr:Holliday junction resolvase RuvX [Candidatus Gracilibacteria bacterium]